MESNTRNQEPRALRLRSACGSVLSVRMRVRIGAQCEDGLLVSGRMQKKAPYFG
jgi:hypothetical protein